MSTVRNSEIPGIHPVAREAWKAAEAGADVSGWRITDRAQWRKASHEELIRDEVARATLATRRRESEEVAVRMAAYAAQAEEEERHLNACEDPECPCWWGEAVGWFELV